jgi:hypothetical protein
MGHDTNVATALYSQIQEVGKPLCGGSALEDGPSRTTPIPNFLIADHRSIVTIAPVSPAAHEWLDENATSEPWQWQGGALSVEHRCAGDLIQAIEVAGFDISH